MVRHRDRDRDRGRGTEGEAGERAKDSYLFYYNYTTQDENRI
jgi:hypothetical protein